MVTKDVTLPVTNLETRQMTRQAFLDWADENTHAEWVDGEVTIFMPAKYVHQNTLKFLYELLALFVGLFGLGKVIMAPFEMKLRHGRSYREPDLLFIAQENLDRLTAERLEGPADLVIEIVSDDSVQRDRRDKFKEYQNAGISEYWIIDPRPDKQRADFFRLAEDGQYELFATEDDEQIFSQVLPGFWLRPHWLWQADSLNALTCSLENKAVAAAVQQQLTAVQQKE